MHYSCDVCVMGAGPAGGAVANRLARLGFRVLVVEAAAFPRRHVGESLPPSVLPLLDQLSVRHDVERAGLLRPVGTIVRWAGKERERPSEMAGYQVDRGHFDALLLQAARRAGAAVLQPVVVAQPKRLGSFEWRVPVRGQDNVDEIRCSFLVDATGRRGVLPGKRKRLSPSTLALWAYYSGSAVDARACVEAGTDRWYWGAPLPGGEFNAAVFVDPSVCQRGCGDLDSTYGQLLSESKLLSSCLGGVRMTAVAAGTAAVSRVEQPVGDDWIKVGESAVAVDPLASQGVVAAIAGGLQAAAVVNTVLRLPSQAALARAFYRDRVRETAENNAASAAEFYRAQAAVSPTEFWRTRATLPALSDNPRAIATTESKPLLPDTVLHKSRALRFEPTPVLSNSMIQLELAAVHPNLSRPVVWLGGTRLADALLHIDGMHSAKEILQRWSLSLRGEMSARVLHWLWTHELITSGTT